MSEKTEEPTPRRLRKAREQGDSPVSAPLLSAAALSVGLVVAPAALSALLARSASHLQSAIAGAGESLSAQAIAREVVVLAGPVIALSALAALALGLVQTGGVLSFQRLAPDLARTNPFAQLAALFNWQRATSVLRALFAAALIAGYAGHCLYATLGDFAGTVGDLRRATALALDVTRELAWCAALVGLALAGVDVLVARYAWRRRHRMTRDEIQREQREAEGDPQIKAARRRAHQETLAGATIASVKTATVLIVNPTHLAVALHYVEDADEAPRVVGQGAGDLARRMIEAAHAYGVPVVRDVPVARALSELEVGDEIPEALYEAVAEILREIWTHAPPDARGKE
jgi:type III secretion protein U